MKNLNSFSGLILYHTLKGEFVNGWKYVNGEITHTVSKPVDRSGNLKSGYYSCTTYSVYGWYQDCVTSNWVTTWSSGEYYGSETECGSPYEVYEGSYEVCDYIDTGDDDSGGGSGGGYNPGG